MGAALLGRRDWGADGRHVGARGARGSGGFRENENAGGTTRDQTVWDIFDKDYLGLNNYLCKTPAKLERILR